MNAVSQPEPGAVADETIPITVEVDRGSASSRGRPPEHAWLVRIQRADQSVIVAIGLSRTAADHLAARITDIITPTMQRRVADDSTHPG